MRTIRGIKIKKHMENASLRHMKNWERTIKVVVLKITFNWGRTMIRGLEGTFQDE